MTKTEWQSWALSQLPNYPTSRSHDEHLAKQWQEVRDGVRKREKEPTQMYR